MKTKLPFKLCALVVAALFSAVSASAQLSFTNANSKISTMNSGCAVTVTDANFDGLDDIVRMDQGHILYYDIQNKDGSFTNHLIADLASGSAWAMTCADVDNNGWKDVMMDGNSVINLVKISGAVGNLTHTVTALPNSGFFLQNATFLDANNDGWLDLFCCDDNAASHIYMNDGAGNLLLSNFINFELNPGVTYNGDPADSGNYGSCWIDFDNDADLDLYVAHCRQSSSSPTDLRRINRLFVNNGNNTFTEMGNTYGIDIGWQTWTASFGDLNNDGDLDLVLTNHDYVSQIFENDGTGHYTENTTSGFNTTSITPIESVVEDFDNDGWADILVTGSEWMFWKNNGDMTFTRVTGLFANNGMLSFACGDLNHDGFIDIYASYGNIYTTPTNTPDVLYLNNRNSNHFLTFDLRGTISAKNAVGARVTIYGAFGVQVREIRAGESYGTCNSSQLHFGLGMNQSVDSAVVWFPSGTTQTLYNIQGDQFITVVENSCVIRDNFISGPTAICTGQTATINAAAGFASYLWSDGSTNQSLTVSSAGIYNVEVSDGNGCTNISRSIDLQLNPDETPTVTVNGDLEFCQGGYVTLISSLAAGYTWSNGDTTRLVNVDASGSYTVTINGQCGAFTSTPVNVDVLAAPAPTAQGATINGPGTATLTATGNDLYWYDQPTGGALLGQGPSFTTPVINSPTTYYVEDVTNYPGALNYTGITYHSGNSLFSGNTTSANLLFTVLAPCVLNSVKVYTDVAGVRQIQILDAATNTVLDSVLVNIPLDSSRVTLNFNLAPGNYRINTNSAVNNANLGYNAPRLRRNSSGVAYPYTVNNLISITNSNQGGGFYYYFYDWEVQEESFACTSERVPVVADVLTSVNSLLAANGVKIYPNPANDFVNVETNSTEPVILQVYDAASRLVRTDRLTNGANRLSISDLHAGMYQLRIVKDGNTLNYKLMVQ